MEIIPNRVIAWTIIKRISKIANVKHKVFPHALRATFATILVSKGFKELELVNIFGWKTMDMAKEYVKFGEYEMQKSFEKW